MHKFQKLKTKNIHIFNANVKNCTKKRPSPRPPSPLTEDVSAKPEVFKAVNFSLFSVHCSIFTVHSSLLNQFFHVLPACTSPGYSAKAPFCN